MRLGRQAVASRVGMAIRGASGTDGTTLALGQHGVRMRPAVEKGRRLHITERDRKHPREPSLRRKIDGPLAMTDELATTITLALLDLLRRRSSTSAQGSIWYFPKRTAMTSNGKFLLMATPGVRPLRPVGFAFCCGGTDNVQSCFAPLLDLGDDTPRNRRSLVSDFDDFCDTLNST